MASFVRTKHDLGFLRQDGTTTVGLRIARDKNGQPIYRSYDDEYLAQQMTQGLPGYENLPPEKELALVRDDWRGGFGQEYDDEEKRYHDSVGSDGRFKNKFILGPKVTSIAAPTIPNPTIVNADMELGTGWTGGVQSSTEKHGGTYSWKLENVVGSIAAYQNIYDAQFRCISVTMTAWVYGTGAGEIYIQVGDNVGSTNSGNNTGIGWEQLTVTHAVNKAATYVRLAASKVVNDANPNYFDDVTATVSTNAYAACASIIKFNSLQYMGFGIGLFKLNGTGDGWTFLRNFPAAITCLEIFGAYLFIAIGNSNACWYMDTSETITESTLANNTMKYLCTVKGTADTLWGSDTASSLRSTTNPLNGGTAWSSAKTIDSTTYSICELITRGNILYIRKQDRPFYLDSSGNVQCLVHETEHLAVSLDGKKSATFLDDVFMQWGNQSLLWWDVSSSVFSWVSPAKYLTGLSAYTGVVQALAADEEYLYACCDNSTKAEILAGRNEEVDGITQWRWHPSQEITITGVQIAYVSTVYKKRLWITSTVGTEAVQYIPVTTQYGSIESDTDYTYLTGGYFISSWHHLNFKGDIKAFIKITLTQSGNTANIYWGVSYKKLGDSSWTTIGNFTGATATQTKYIPVDASSNKPKSTLMQFKFTATTNNTAVSPVLLAYDVRAVLYPTNRRIIETEVLAGDEVKAIDGSIDSGQGAVIKTAIEEARAATWPVDFYDLNWASSGDTIAVKFLPTVAQPISKQISPAKIERHYLLKLQVIPLA